MRMLNVFQISGSVSGQRIPGHRSGTCSRRWEGWLVAGWDAGGCVDGDVDGSEDNSEGKQWHIRLTLCF